MTDGYAAEPPLPGARRAQVIRQAVSVGLASGTYGVSFGALSVAAGLSILQTCALSVLMFTRWLAVRTRRRGRRRRIGPAAVATSTLLGLRNGLYGLQLTRLLGLRGVRRLAGAQLTIDESTAVAFGQPEAAAARLGFWATGVTCLRAVERRAPWSGLSPATRSATPRATAWMPPRLRPSWPCSGRGCKAGEARAVAVAAAFVALVLSPAVPAGVPVLAAGLTAVVAGVWLTRPGAATEEERT